MITLYQLVISHYNEKVRWALDLKQVPHTRRSLVPGVHRLQSPRIAGKRTLPALVDTDTGARLGESQEILQYLDERYPEPRLYPDDEPGKARVLELERYFDDNAGTAVRAYGYGHLIDFPRALRARWADGLSSTQRLLLVLTFPVVRRALRRVYSLTPDNTLRRADEILRVCDQIEAWLEESGSGYLHGDAFGAADLTAAALLGPLLRPEGSPWSVAQSEQAAEPGFPPTAYEQFRDQFMQRAAARWALDIWHRHRGC